MADATVKPWERLDATPPNLALVGDDEPETFTPTEDATVLPVAEVAHIALRQLRENRPLPPPDDAA